MFHLLSAAAVVWADTAGYKPRIVDYLRDLSFSFSAVLVLSGYLVRLLPVWISLATSACLQLILAAYLDSAIIDVATFRNVPRTRKLGTTLVVTPPTAVP